MHVVTKAPYTLQHFYLISNNRFAQVDQLILMGRLKIYKVYATVNIDWKL